ncbi:ArsA family ATPase [Haloarcula argentinensis]|uniref:ArsA family ATPase n=1 Tax=Haloarcula argentinensis TaxID=43776 RepID=A0ABU2EWN5_HALAR|nr:ArsA family ATPase [Haloarcula argentinensis]EMA23718.1 arsenite transport ATPase [Haloarcula argentinensis DSM 12282]MDS0252676.1 ArsA family ATPase [Haloarcula argentinensis]
MTRFLLYGGKGGVGKTTVAAATGYQLAAAGHETLVVSTDPAHSLADAVKTEVGGDPTKIRSGLWGVEVDPQTGIDRYRSLFEALASEFSDAGIRMDEEEIADLFTTGVMPGSDELAAIEGMATYIESDRWDRVVFDTAPTGHTLRLLDLPSVMDRGVATAMDLRDQVHRKVNTARTMMFGPMASRRDDGPDDFTEMRTRMERVGTVLRDPEQTAFRVVTIPETMAVRETERLVAKLREFDVPVTTLVVNKVIADAGDCQRCQGKQAVQEEAIAQLRESLPGLDIWTIPDQSGEVTGIETLEKVGTHLGG